VGSERRLGLDRDDLDHLAWVVREVQAVAGAELASASVS
jgi:hypothetical protein